MRIIRIYNDLVYYFERVLTMNTLLMLGACMALVTGAAAWVCRK